MAAEGTLRAHMQISLLMAVDFTWRAPHVFLVFLPYAAYLCLIILLAVGEMPEYLQDLDDGSVLLFKLCLENATIISEKHSVK